MNSKSLEIQLFGEVAVIRDGEPVSLPQSKKTRALLAYLALNDGPQRRERLCEIFWQVPDDPRGSLRWSLSKLRGIVNTEGAERIEADRANVRLKSELVEIDILKMQRLAADPAAASTNALANAAETLKKGALNDLVLSGQDEYEMWRLSEQEQTRKYHCAVLRELVGRLAHDASAQADILYDFIRIEPYDLTCHTQLISALARAGRKKEAERQLALSEKALDGVDGFDRAALGAAMNAAPDAVSASSSEPAIALINQRQTIRFCKTADGVQIAYATVGEGPPIVKTANWLNHLEFDWESPVWRHIFRACSTDYQFVRYDARGNGLSDWRVKDFSIERQVEDLEAVVEAAGLKEFPLLGISQGCAISVAYAARHPEMVTRLVLYGGYARGWRKGASRAYRKNTEAMITLIRNGWGQDNPVFRQMFASLFMPDAPPENHEWFNELQRMTTSPENAAALLQSLGDVDVRQHLAKVQAPTLVLHASGDMRVPFEAGKELVAGIPNARFMSLESKNHLIPESDPAWPRFRNAVFEFLAD